jgi:TM2 domain-containing membrane protein YozV
MSHRPILCIAIYLYLSVSISWASCYGMDTSQDTIVNQSNQKIGFITYLMGRGELNEALFLLDELKVSTISLADTVNYLKGWTLYNQKALLSSASYLLRVSSDSPYYQKSRFFGGYNLAHAGEHEQAKRAIVEMSTGEEAFLGAMKNMQLSGIALLERDYHNFSKLSEKFTGQYNAFAEQEQNMITYHHVLLSQPYRSPVIAGMLSAAIPGLGKFYAGKKGEGIAGFFYTVAMGATAYDFYRGSGPKSALFIVSGAVAAIFYIGNIWGSVTSVHRQNRAYNYEINQRILFDMHIPLRNAFN